MEFDENKKEKVIVNEDVDNSFDKIVRKEMKCDLLYEDDYTLAFTNIKPVAKHHFLVIPKNKEGLNSLFRAEEKHIDIMGRLLLTASKVAKQVGLEDGYRTVINTGPNAR